MEDRTTKRVIEILETDPDFFVPVKKIWLMLQGEGLAQDLDLNSFHQEIRKDERFEFISGTDYKTGLEQTPDLAEEMELEMEALGFYGGPRVKLTSREMSAEDVFGAMARSLTQMNQALQGAWDSRPEGDQETEHQLLDILAAGQKLEREINKLLEEDLTAEKGE